MADWLVFPAFLVLWTAASIGIARLGWTTLATRYRAWDIYDGDMWLYPVRAGWSKHLPELSHDRCYTPGDCT